MNLMIKNNVRCVVNTEIIDAMKYPIIKIIATRLRPKTSEIGPNKIARVRDQSLQRIM